MVSSIWAWIPIQEIYGMRLICAWEFAGKKTVISGIFAALDSVRPQMGKTG
jgi:hypothetical protein